MPASNKALTPSVIVNEFGRLVFAENPFLRSLNNEYSREFGRSTGKGKIGASAVFRYPPHAQPTITRYKGNQTIYDRGALPTRQRLDEREARITIDTSAEMVVEFDDISLTLDIDNFARRFLEQPARDFAAILEEYVVNRVLEEVPNQVGSMSSTAGFDDLLAAERMLTEALTPEGARRQMVWGTAINEAIVKDKADAFNPRGQIDEQYRTAVVGNNVAGFRRVVRSVRAGSHSYGNYRTGLLINGANQKGDSLICDGGTVGETIKAGTPIKIAGLKFIDPQTKKERSYPKPIVVKEDVILAAATTLKISPPIIYGAAGSQDHGNRNVTATPADNAAVDVVGSYRNDAVAVPANTEIDIGLGYTGEAIYLASPRQELPRDTEMAVNTLMNGINLRMIRYWDPDARKKVTIMDSIFTVFVPYPEWAVRLAQKAS